MMEHEMCCGTTCDKQAVAAEFEKLRNASEQLNELSYILVRVNEFCQQRGIGKIGDSATSALMQRHDELYAEFERLQERNRSLESLLTLAIKERYEALAYGERLRVAWEAVKSTDWDEPMNEIINEQPPASLAALKAEWQAEALEEVAKDIKEMQHPDDYHWETVFVFDRAKIIRELAGKTND